MSDAQSSDNDIAIIGMAARFPGARNTAQFWSNLERGVESVRVFSDAELLEAGVSADQLSHPQYVKSGVVLDEFDGFDAEFFGFSPKEAAIMDPQHRHFLECAWEALEDAGHPPESFGGSVGVFGGCGMGAYFAFNLLTNRELVDSVGLFLLRHTGNDKDFLTTRVSYSLNLRGPSMSVQTACSTSLVATHLACQSLLSGECDMALAGGVTIEIPHRRGYVYNPGEILSPDGHCRAFDHRAEGTIFGSGAGIVVLRRLRDALQDGDDIRAVIKGSAVNNDGAGKVGYLAPSVDGQAAAIAEAIGVSGVSADSIGYVECHGTGTAMGDPIELSALTHAFRQSTTRSGYCAIGSVKTNIGHLDTAAGVASLIKASLALRHRKIPPSLNFEAPNPQIDFANSPFFVSRDLRDWPAGPEPRRAGVNSLGVGGTNAYVIVEEPPPRAAGVASRRPYQLLTLSARSRVALDAASTRLAEHLAAYPEQDLADVAYTLQVGRRAFAHRRVLAAASREDAAKLLSENDPRRVFTHVAPGETPSVAFMFPGGGAQYPRMARGLYDTEPVFREWVDRGLALLRGKLDVDLRPLLFPTDEALADATSRLERPSLQLPAIFIIEYALAQLWLSWGVHPAALIGHSMGENTAACLSQVFRFEDALGLVLLRGQLMDEVPQGGMLSVSLPAAELTLLLGDDLDLASVNGPELSVASGPRAALEELERKLAARGVDAKWVRIHIAAHSRMLEPIIGRYESYLKSIPLSPPKIPVVSNLTGTWLTREEATNPGYWALHLRRTVLFADGIKTLLEDPRRVLLEVGPGKTLSSLARQHPNMGPGQPVLSTLRHADEDVPDAAFFLAIFGRLWASGVDVDLEKARSAEKRRRVSLPTYAFQHQRYFIEPGKLAALESKMPRTLAKLPKLEDWFYRPVWKAAEAPGAASKERQTWLVFMDEDGLGDELVARLGSRGHDVVVVHPSDAYYQLSHNEYRLSPEHGRDGYDALVRDLVASGKMPDRIAHLWLVATHEDFRPGPRFFHRNQERGFYSLFFLAQALGEQSSRRPMHIVVVSSGMQQIDDEPLPYPDQATVLGPCKVIPRELAGVTCASIDVALPPLKRSRLFDPPTRSLEGLSSQLVTELLSEPGNRVVALRRGERFEQTYEKMLLDAKPAAAPIDIRPGGTYLITGGLGGIGMTMAKHLASRGRVKLVLVSRSVLPDRSSWDAWLSRHDDTDPTSRKIEGVRELEARGAEVLVVTADVTDPERMAQGLAVARKQFGALNGVIHAAGVLGDELIQTKTQASVENVFGPKVRGTLVLDSLVRDAPLDFFILFSSTSTVTGPIGQVDYVGANAFLNAYAQSRRRDRKTRTIAISWGIWNEVGMAAAAAHGLGHKPAQEAPPAVESVPAHPLFRAHTKEGEQHIFTGRYGPRTQWILDEHRTIDGGALVPGTAYLEIARAALAELGEKAPFEIRDLLFLRPLAVGDDQTKDVRTKLSPNEQGYDLEIHSRAEGNTDDHGWELHAQAKLVLGTVGATGPLDLFAIAKRCQDGPYTDPNGIASGQENHLRFGRRWRVLREASYGSGEALGRLELSQEFTSDLEHYALHPALLDIATGFAMDLIDGYKSEALWVPVLYRRVCVRAPLPSHIVSWVKIHGASSSADFASFDVVLADEAGNVLVEVDELTLRRLSGALDLAAQPQPSARRQAVSSAQRNERTLSPAELAFVQMLKLGISPVEGGEAFDRVLSGVSHPLVVVSSMNLFDLVARADAMSIERTDSSARFARPELATSYVAPRDEIERTLVGFWEELLGVDKVGAEDSFFDLGGHSLIAVRLFAKIKKAYRVDYPISVLFGAPTIARCAALIRSTVGTGGAETRDALDPHRTRLTHLVPMHPASNKRAEQKAPFFLVAGMFGNVLNLRHLAHLIGQERRFYGLQARGLYGDHTPHENFEAMAADYIAELRTAQSKGPYLLGGFSGGGITAYEMARQLIEAGEEVALLVLLDTPLPTSPPLTSRDRWMLHLHHFRQRGPAHLVEWVRNRYAWETNGRRRRPENGEAKSPFDFHSEAIEAAFRSALDRYDLKKLPLHITLFRPKLDVHAVLGPGRVINRDRRFVYHDNGWAPYVDGVEVFEMPGDHDSMVLEPNVRVLAGRLRECIEKAERTPLSHDRVERIEVSSPREAVGAPAVPTNGMRPGGSVDVVA